MRPFVYYWRFEDGTQVRRGWHAMAYKDGAPDDFADWMVKHMKGKYEATLRFNSGNPAYLIYIEDEADAAVFKLRWNEQIKENTL